MRDSLDSSQEKKTYKNHNQYLGMILETIRDDCATQEEYKKISSIIPEWFVVERQPIAWSEEMFCFKRYYTKRKLNIETEKEIIDKLKSFSSYQNINWNKLNIKFSWNDCFIHTIYKSD